MLFDLRGRGRRRTVRIVYSGLALLFLLGFVGFGVGGGFGGSGSGGGVLEAVFGGSENGNGPNYEAQVKRARKLTVQQPNNPSAWSGLIHALLLQAGSGENYNSNENVFTTKAQPQLKEISAAWQRYLKLEPHHPSSEIAAEALRVYTSPGGVNEPAQAVKAIKIEIADRAPSASLYYDLALLSYQAKDKTEGDRASKKAIALAPSSEKKVLEAYLAQAKSGKTAATTAGGTAAAGGASTATTATLTTGTVKGVPTPAPTTSAPTTSTPATPAPAPSKTK
jgi:hypothetical protein